MWPGVEDTYRYCPTCGSPMQTSMVAPGQPAKRHCTACDFVYYHNPRPCAGALVENTGRVLLLRRACEPGRGLWEIAGGFMEPNETPWQTACRELFEETRLVLQPVRLLGVWPAWYGENSFPTLNVYFLATSEQPDNVCLSSESLEYAWMSTGETPKQFAFPHEAEVVRCWACGQDHVYH